jgi:protein SCO1
MKWIFKAGLLVSLLALPVLIYVFLQLFGQNYYELPVYYEEGISNPPSACQEPYSAPVQVDLISLQDTTVFTEQNVITILAFVKGKCGDDCQIKFNQITRLLNFFMPQKDSLRAVVIVVGNDKEKIVNQFDIQDNLYFVTLLENEWQEFSNCELLMPLSDQQEVEAIHQVVLLDEYNRIRGYYNGLSLEEIDRLTTEIRLLLYEYQQKS